MVSSQENENNVFTKKDLYKTVHISFIHNFPKINDLHIHDRKINEEIVVFLYNEVLLRNLQKEEEEKEEEPGTKTQNNMDEPQKYYVEVARYQRAHNEQFHLHEVLWQEWAKPK